LQMTEERSSSGEISADYEVECGMRSGVRRGSS